MLPPGLRDDRRSFPPVIGRRRLDEFPISRVDCRHWCRSVLSQGERTLVKSATELGAVANQYEKWVYPFPIPDLDAPDVRTRRDGGDFERNWHTFWPDRPYREDLDVLVAGCGSNAAARYAFNHRKARVTGIDLSSASLAHEAYLKEKHRLDNLALHRVSRTYQASPKTLTSSTCPGCCITFRILSVVSRRSPASCAPKGPLRS